MSEEKKMAPLKPVEERMWDLFVASWIGNMMRPSGLQQPPEELIRKATYWAHRWCDLCHVEKKP